jgi:hypothetical protein
MRIIKTATVIILIESKKLIKYPGCTEVALKNPSEVKLHYNGSNYVVA